MLEMLKAMIVRDGEPIPAKWDWGFLEACFEAVAEDLGRPLDKEMVLLGRHVASRDIFPLAEGDRFEWWRDR